ncbi:MAG: hypothetical protein GEU80_12715 [Dehalococcoidia bacterium]|nr:hypothetical protein [Dehalococcoidia bacterium]
MDPPVRRCPGCHLKVHTPVKMEDGRSYCESCAERINEELAAPGDAPHAEPEARMPDNHSMSNGADSSGDGMLRVVPTPERAAPPLPAPSPAPAPVAVSAPEDAAPPRPATAPPGDRALDGTLENLLERERDRLHEHRAEVEARIRRAETELDAIAERLEHIGGLLTEPAYEEARAV